MIRSPRNRDITTRRIFEGMLVVDKDRAGEPADLPTGN